MNAQMADLCTSIGFSRISRGTHTKNEIVYGVYEVYPKFSNAKAKKEQKSHLFIFG